MGTVGCPLLASCGCCDLDKPRDLGAAAPFYLFASLISDWLAEGPPLAAPLAVIRVRACL